MWAWYPLMACGLRTPSAAGCNSVMAKIMLWKVGAVQGEYGAKRKERKWIMVRELTMARRRFIVTGAVLAVGVLVQAPPAHAAYPERPVKIVVANTPGGPSDIVARIMAAAMQEAMGGSVFVENKGGAGGNIGMGSVARAEPDGYTILLSTSAYAVNPSLTTRCRTTRSRISPRSASWRSRRMCSR